MKPRWAQESHTHPAAPGGNGGVPWDYMYYSMPTNGNGTFADTLGIDDSSSGTNSTGTYGGGPSIGFGNLAMWPRACRSQSYAGARAYFIGGGGFLSEKGLWYRVTFGTPVLPSDAELFAGLICLSPGGTDYDSNADAGNIGVILNRNGGSNIEWICRDNNTSSDVDATTCVNSYAVDEAYTLTLEIAPGGSTWSGTLTSTDGVNETFEYTTKVPLSDGANPVGLSMGLVLWSGSTESVATWVRGDALVPWPTGDGAPI